MIIITTPLLSIRICLFALHQVKPSLGLLILMLRCSSLFDFLFLVLSIFQSLNDFLCAIHKDDVEAEMRRLKLELKQTMDMYSTACKEALTAKQKVSFFPPLTKPQIHSSYIYNFDSKTDLILGNGAPSLES